MATFEVKTFGELIKSLLPTDERKGRFYQTFFGSLFGQTILLISLLISYVAAIVLAYAYAKTPLQTFRDDFGAFWFWTFLAGPLACILLFQMLPTSWRALREHRLKIRAIRGAPQPGHFRLSPYDKADRKHSSGSTGLTLKS
jgi:hypothetical protein